MPENLIILGKEELQQLISNSVNAALINLKPEQQSTINSTGLLTRQQFATKFDVSLPTLWRWERDGFIKPVRIGRRLFFPEAYIEKLLS